ncbi:YkvI family membrane protein [Rummeliibacillus pycnus]|uniref:YkvI family membrane protein n=1 Tax=Rummeliibacillus pycnus TaxID=101070 RepID=UPI003D28BBB7
MKKSIEIAGAFIGVIVGAGFASGQEILQFFTGFGWWGVVGTAIATVLFAFLGMNLTTLGSRLNATSHKEVVYKICGKYLGAVVDFVITFFLFGVAVVMFAGAGSIFENQFGISAMYGSLAMLIVTILTLMFNVQKIIAIISAITPFLMVLVVIIAGYSIFTTDLTAVQMDKLAKQQNSGASNWILGALLYVSYNIAAGASMLTVMGGQEKDEKIARRGGILGGIGLGLLILLINVAIFTKLDQVGGTDMPMLVLATKISPILGVLMSIALLGMIYNTAVGMLYAFSVRIVPARSKHFNWVVWVIGAIGFGLSFVGFIKLVGTVYPAMGYLGFILMISIVIAWGINVKRSKVKSLVAKEA